ncbi:putative ariadne-1 protein [Tilletiaria anomala UBC 951]|uniref:RBR-type E3 ubiquitin transferase n=1 Tax=Tilletiaria anomala (strain ATCC 24038 / CBS 436.72 / UBC 951) TaxID=1037660 RepID=A0A066VUS2_TILAU|nr:putative ariadne-1 protein [Tilletiaria anomala UBC 951]KDN42290.1 putative ariadne-1 protein [Tilletiaria anomala UBC 951]
MDEDSEGNIFESDLSDDDDDAFMGDDTHATGLDDDDDDAQDFGEYEEDDDIGGLGADGGDAMVSPSVGDEGDAVFFGSQDIGRARKASYEVDYKSHTIASIEALQQKEIDQISAMFNVKDTDAAILLRHMSWNKERLIERYMDAPEDVKYEAGVMDDPARPRILQMTYDDDFTCEVCYTSTDELPATSTPKGKSATKSKARSADVPPPDGQPFVSTLALGCGHRFCKNCYSEYMLRKIREEGESRRVQCMDDKCKLVVDERTVSLLVTPDILEKYRTLLNRTFVDDSGIMRWCPAPNCELAVECHVSQKKLSRVVPSVKCGQGHEFCFGCGNETHAPAVCPLVKLWLKKCADDSETSNWIKANTQDCPNPKCNSVIEKNGGCNHMTCRKCKYEFCWICEGPWSEHGTSWYNCNRFDENKAKSKDSKNSSRLSLERYLHYYNRYINHEQSARLDENLVAQTQKSMDAMQEAGVLTWSEVQFLSKAAASVTECRMTLKWTYAMAYYLKCDNQTELFEDNQRDLERAVEQLSEQLQKPVQKDTIQQLRQEVTDLMVYVQKRREIVLADTAAGYQEGRWEFVVSV